MNVVENGFFVNDPRTASPVALWPSCSFQKIKSLNLHP